MHLRLIVNFLKNFKDFAQDSDFFTDCITETF